MVMTMIMMLASKELVWCGNGVGVGRIVSPGNTLIGLRRVFHRTIGAS